MGKARGRKGEKRLADKTVVPETEKDSVLHAPEDCPDCLEELDPVVLSPTDRVMTRMQLHNGRLVDFALMQQRLDKGTWYDVATFDCRHGTVHVHWYDAQGERSSRTELRPISGQQDVEAGFEQAAAMLFDNWEENLRRRVT